MANGLWEFGKLCKEAEKHEKKRHGYPEQEESASRVNLVKVRKVRGKEKKTRNF